MTLQEADAIRSDIEAEYALETERKRSLLRSSGIAEGDLSKNGQMYLHVLSEVAELLQLKDTRTSSYLMAVSDLIEAVDVAEATEQALKEEAEASQKRMQDLEDESRELERVKQQLEEAVEEREKLENTTTMEQRTVEYSERQRNYENELNELVATLSDLRFPQQRDMIEHHVIAELERDCQEIEAGNAELREQLREFHDLPLHVDLAAATLREAQDDLAQLEDEFNRHIRAMV